MTSVNISKITCIFCGLCAFGAFGLTRSARAALGDDVASVEQDRARMGASLQVRRSTGYDVHEMAAPIGSTVREFVGPDGKVFAVSWSGGWRPNLRDLMGVHYDRFIAGMAGRRRSRAPVRLELPGMVVVMGGHLRTFFGHAYLTDMLPAGFSTQEMR